jgi:hypothetical protein
MNSTVGARPLTRPPGTLSPLGRGGTFAAASRQGLGTADARPLTRPSGTLSPVGRGERTREHDHG